MSPTAIRQLKRVTRQRQIEMVELMICANNFSAAYAEALVLGIPDQQIAAGSQPKKKKSLSAEKVAELEQEMRNPEREFRNCKVFYADVVINLALVRGYLRELLANGKISGYLATAFPDIFGQFQSIAEGDLGDE